MGKPELSRIDENGRLRLDFNTGQKSWRSAKSVSIEGQPSFLNGNHEIDHKMFRNEWTSIVLKTVFSPDQRDMFNESAENEWVEGAEIDVKALDVKVPYQSDGKLETNSESSTSLFGNEKSIAGFEWKSWYWAIVAVVVFIGVRKLTK